MLLGSIGISVSHKVAALVLSLFLVSIHKVVWRTCEKVYNQVPVALEVSGECPCTVKPVKVKILTEALCIDCQCFVQNHLLNAYDTLGPNVMDLHTVPFGNTKFGENKSITCQHGVGECDANSYEQCMIHAYPSPKQYLPMLACLENELPMGAKSSPFGVDLFAKCAEKANLDFGPIQFCHDNKALADKVLHEAADATPDYHTHVPWVEINGKYMDEEKYDFITEVCKAYAANGGSHPACSNNDETTVDGAVALTPASQRSLDKGCPCNRRVKVKVLIEALCPGCHEFVLHQLIGTFNTLGSDVMDLQVVPFGNAKMVNDTVVCQHGIGECDANSYEQCMIHSFPHPEQYLPMLQCLEKALPMGSKNTKFPPSIFEKCARQAHLGWGAIVFCHDTEAYAKKVLEEAAAATPEHKYVPWIIIDGSPMDLETQDFKEQVCKAYKAKGGSHPACDDKSRELESSSSSFDLCY